jgi:LmbE family N-acetylglucosaminyl deacetylase
LTLDHGRHQPAAVLAVLAHPTTNRSASAARWRSTREGVEVFLLTATRGDGGRYRGLPQTDPGHPGRPRSRHPRAGAARRRIGARHPRRRAARLPDQHSIRADPREAVSADRGASRRARPDVVLTFGPDGAYGHPDHVAHLAIHDAPQPSPRRMRRFDGPGLDGRPRTP